MGPLSLIKGLRKCSSNVWTLDAITRDRLTNQHIFEVVAHPTGSRQNTRREWISHTQVGTSQAQTNASREAVTQSEDPKTSIVTLM